MDNMFRRQMANNLNWNDYDCLDAEAKENLLKDYVLLAMDELVELLRVVNYKEHRPIKKPVVRSNILEEVTDTFKYLLSILLLYGFDAEEFVNAFYQKSDIVDLRWNMEQIDWTDKKILAVDIDGVIADYFTGFSSYLFNECFVDNPINARNHNTYDLTELYGLKKEDELMAANNFCEEGGYFELPCYEFAAEGLLKASVGGYKIILVTSRPYMMVRRIYNDTVCWLSKNKIVYDAIYWGNDKAAIIDKYFSKGRPKYFIEDRDKHAIEIANSGIQVLLLDRPYNRRLVDYPNIKRVKDWHEIEEILQGT